MNVVDLFEQIAPGVDSEWRLPWRRFEIFDLERRLGWIAVENERLMPAAEITGRLTVRRGCSRIPDLGGKKNRSREIAARTENARDDRSHERLNVRLGEIVSGHHEALAVFVGGAGLVIEAADQRDLVHHASHEGEMLADLNAGNVGPDWLELAADVAGGIGLHVPGIELPGRADQEKDDAVLNLGGGFVDRACRFQNGKEGQ